jgi:GGDEF domain-containing protein
LISIRKSVDELERLQRLQQATAANYAMALRAAAEYAVELEPSQAGQFRQHLNALQVALQKASREEDYQVVQSSFRGELRAYRDQSQDWLARVRGELQAAAEAMQTLANGLSANGVDHEKQLKKDLQALSSAINIEDLSQVRAVVRAAVASIAEGHDQARRANQMMVAQLHDEIRSLHREIDSERRANYTDPFSGAWNRRKCEDKLGELLQHGEAFCVVLVWLSNLKRMETSASRAVIDGTLKALVKRATGIAGKDAPIGRWSTDEFLVFLELEPASASSVSGELSKQLSSRYAIQEHGVSQQVSLRVDTVVVDRPTGTDPERFRQRLDQTSAVLRGV